MERLLADLNRALHIIEDKKVCQICFQPFTPGKWQSCHEECLEKVLTEMPEEFDAYKGNYE